MIARRLTRKQFIQLGTAAGAGALVAACGVPPAATPPAAPAATAAAKPADQAQPQVAFNTLATTKPAKFNEPPMLVDLVKAGKLPPVEKRLPEEPLVIKPLSIGTYGGTIRTGDIIAGRLRGSDHVNSSSGFANTLRITPDLANYTVGAGIAKDVKASSDKSTYTVTLRKGHKWSDGQPLTSKDIMFWFEDILQNKELSPSISPEWRPGGKLMEVTAPDDLTVVFKFAVPKPVFPLSNLAHTMPWYKGENFHPAHYLKQFHPKHNPKAEEESKAAKYESWYARFGDEADRQKAKNRPHLTAYNILEVRTTGVRYERNPYYYAVDTEGNQLPYVDYHEMEYASNVEMYDAKIVTGAYDYAAHNTSVLNYTAYAAGQQQGNYKVILLNSGKGGEVFFNVNMNAKDEVIRKIHQDVRFRRALSLAINREEMNQLLFFGKGIPRQMTVIRSSKYFKPDYETASANYDPQKANALLDELGLKWSPDKTVRLLPNGQPLQYSFDYFPGEGPKTAVVEIVQDFWRKIGVNITGKVVTRQLLTTRVQANDELMSLWHGDASTDVLLPQDRKWSSAKLGDESTMAPLWAAWYESGGKSGEEPADWFRPVFEAFTKYRDTLEPEWAHKLLSLQSENLWSIGTVGQGPNPVIVRTNLTNFPESGMLVWDGNFGWPYFTECVYFKK